MKWPTQSRILSAIKKHGLTLQGPDENKKYWVEKNGKIASWYLQDGRATSFRINEITDTDYILTDYFPGYFVNTIKAMIGTFD